MDGRREGGDAARRARPGGADGRRYAEIAPASGREREDDTRVSPRSRRPTRRRRCVRGRGRRPEKVAVAFAEEPLRATTNPRHRGGSAPVDERGDAVPTGAAMRVEQGRATVDAEISEVDGGPPRRRHLEVSALAQVIRAISRSPTRRRRAGLLLRDAESGPPHLLASEYRGRISRRRVRRTAALPLLPCRPSPAVGYLHAPSYARSRPSSGPPPRRGPLRRAGVDRDRADRLCRSSSGSLIARLFARSNSDSRDHDGFPPGSFAGYFLFGSSSTRSS